MNTKYISSSELKTSEFSRVRSTSENFYVFNSRDLVFAEKSKFSFYFIQYTGIFQFTRQAVKMQKQNFIENTIILVPHCSLRSNYENEYPHFVFSFINNGVIDV